MLWESHITLGKLFNFTYKIESDAYFTGLWQE